MWQSIKNKSEEEVEEEEEEEEEAEEQDDDGTISSLEGMSYYRVKDEEHFVG